MIVSCVHRFPVVGDVVSDVCSGCGHRDHHGPLRFPLPPPQPSPFEDPRMSDPTDPTPLPVRPTGESGANMPPPNSWRLEAAAKLREIADAFERGDGSAVLVQAVVGQTTPWYRGASDDFNGALCVTRALDLLDRMRVSINGEKPPG